MTASTTTYRWGRILLGAVALGAAVAAHQLPALGASGLLHPARDPDSRYRLYDEQQMRRLRVVVLLREAGYDFPAIRATLEELAAGQPAQAIAAVEQRRADLARASWACLTVLPAFQAYVSTFWPELCTAL